ncbi:MAG: hypothetical protein SHS37scaffold537_29 [Phage 68_12]|nr:MAG: hypothetical protein SHS37scaffold537_29 [Phage 68_12]
MTGPNPNAPAAVSDADRRYTAATDVAIKVLRACNAEGIVTDDADYSIGPEHLASNVVAALRVEGLI